MSFWQKQDGSAVESSTTFESGGGEITPIPNNTALIGAIEEAKWSEYQGEHYINLKWRVMRPAEYANRVLFQKLKVFSPKQGDKAKQMLAAIDANAGGKLAKLKDAPEDMDLMTALVGKAMAIKVQIWDIDGKTGNWISAVALHHHKTHTIKQNLTPTKRKMMMTIFRFNLTHSHHKAR